MVDGEGDEGKQEKEQKKNKRQKRNGDVDDRLTDAEVIFVNAV